MRGRGAPSVGAKLGGSCCAGKLRVWWGRPVRLWWEWRPSGQCLKGGFNINSFGVETEGRLRLRLLGADSGWQRWWMIQQSPTAPPLQPQQCQSYFTWSFRNKINKQHPPSHSSYISISTPPHRSPTSIYGSLWINYCSQYFYIGLNKTVQRWKRGVRWGFFFPLTGTIAKSIIS